MNACTILTEIADYKTLYLDMLSPRAIEMYREYLGSEDSSAKQNIYVLLSLLLCKYRSHMEDDKPQSESRIPRYDLNHDSDEDEEHEETRPKASSPEATEHET